MHNTDFQAIRNARRARDKDAAIKLELGLRYAGLHYTPYQYPARPHELYADKDGNHYIKVGLSQYERLEGI